MSDTVGKTPGLTSTESSNIVHAAHPSTKYLRKILNGRFNKFGEFEFPIVTNNKSDKSLCLMSTNANDRVFDRVGVEHCGAVPRQSSRVLLYRKTFLDWPISVGVSSWIGTNDAHEKPGDSNHG